MATTEPASNNVMQDDLAQRFLRDREDLEVDKLFRALVKLEGSDLHLKVKQPPIVRVDGTLKPLNRAPIEAEEMVRLLIPMLDERNRKIFDDTGGADFAYVVDVDGEEWRFRVNMLQQLGNVGLVARRINNLIPKFEGLNLPPVIEKLCKYDQGMVLLAGVTGSGKSTTIASMLNWINNNYRKHILTLEDPIEFVFHDDKCLINQREIGQDVVDFSVAMKHAVREDPDIILVGEMRDEETFMTAIHAAETGHLVFGTIHASSAPTTIGRILDLFPEEMHGAIRSAIVAHPERWTRAIRDPRFRRAFRLEGDRLTRPPRGFDPDHALVEDLKRKDFIAVADLTEEEACAPGFIDKFARLCARSDPFMKFLTTAVGLRW